jgi:hypothetical protein
MCFVMTICLLVWFRRLPDSGSAIARSDPRARDKEDREARRFRGVVARQPRKRRVAVMNGARPGERGANRLERHERGNPIAAVQHWLFTADEVRTFQEIADG